MGDIWQPCKPGCEDCYDDLVRFNELIETLSQMHVSGFKLPELLCAEDESKFKKDHPDFSKLSIMQNSLFNIASRHGVSWTMT